MKPRDPWISALLINATYGKFGVSNNMPNILKFPKPAARLLPTVTPRETRVMLTYENDFVIEAESADMAATVMNWYCGLGGSDPVYKFTRKDFVVCPIETNFVGGYTPSELSVIRRAIVEGRAFISRGFI